MAGAEDRPSRWTFYGADVKPLQVVCRYPEATGEVVEKVPVVIFDKQFADMPCTGLTGETLSSRSMNVSSVSVSGCLAQRQAGLCPRELGLNVPEGLKRKP